MSRSIRGSCMSHILLFIHLKYRYVLGHEAMRKMIHSNVLIVGLKGLGVEVGNCFSAH